MPSVVTANEYMFYWLVAGLFGIAFVGLFIYSYFKK